LAQQRNNLARLPWSVREIACGLMFDGAGNADIAQAVAAACREQGIRPKPVYGSTIVAYRDSDEYRRYADHRRKWDAEQAEARSLWSAINADGSAESAVQAARYLGLRSIVSQLQDGDLSPNDTNRLASALSRMQADLLDEAKAEHDAELQAIAARHEAELAAIQKQLAERHAEIQGLRDALEEKTGHREVDTAKLADEMDKVLQG
jgi:hypothetical protein